MATADQFAAVRTHCLSVDGVTEKLSPYVGGRGWVGVRLDRALPSAELHELLDEAHAAVRR